MSDVMTLADVRAAVEHLRRSNAPAPDGHYVAFVSRRQRGWFLGMALVDAWDANLRARWAADERRSRAGGGA
jgi:hypothetical protein